MKIIKKKKFKENYWRKKFVRDEKKRMLKVINKIKGSDIWYIDDWPFIWTK